MAITLEDILAMEVLEERLRTLLPEQYRDAYETLTPVPMRSAALKYDAAGRVAWDEIWATFCDLAMAGGPPHRGSLLEPGTPRDIAEQPEAYIQNVEEICRGLAMVTGLAAQPAPVRGWVELDCESPGMAAWLTRAIVMENVMARSDGERLYLPVGPDFRVVKEIRNVITSTAKTCHYWTSHTPADQKAAIERFLTDEDEGPLLEPPLPSERREPDSAYHKLVDTIGAAIERATGLHAAPHKYVGWIGIVCPGIGPAICRPAIWITRALVASNILSRREEAILYIPVNAQTDPVGDRAAGAFTAIHRLATGRKVL